MATAQNTDTKKKKKKRGCFWRIVFWLALIVFIGSVGTLGYLFYTYWQGQNEYEEIASRVVEAPEDGHVANLADLVVDWDALRAINRISSRGCMPGTIINYPVAHKDGDSVLPAPQLQPGRGLFRREFGSIMLSGENARRLLRRGEHHSTATTCATAPCSPSLPSSATRLSSTSIAPSTCSLPRGQLPLTNFCCGACAHDPCLHRRAELLSDRRGVHGLQGLARGGVRRHAPIPTPPIRLPTRRSSSVSACDRADNIQRYITFADVAEFVPISYVGADTYQGDTAVEDDAAGEIAADAQERVEGW